MPRASAPVADPIRLALRRGASSVSLKWPTSAAAECGAWRRLCTGRSGHARQHVLGVVQDQPGGGSVRELPAGTRTPLPGCIERRVVGYQMGAELNLRVYDLNCQQQELQEQT